MSAPKLTAQIQGQTVADADRLNTYEQTCDIFSQLRQFVGLPGIQVFARGAGAINDGAAGEFYWDSTATGPDDNLNVIVPTGNAGAGAWVRVSLSGLPATKSLYVKDVFMEGKPAAGEIYPNINTVVSCIFPAGLVGSQFSIDPAKLPTAPLVVTLRKNTVSFATVTFDTSGIPTVVAATAATFLTAPGYTGADQFSILWPADQDATAENITMNFLLTVI